MSDEPWMELSGVERSEFIQRVQAGEAPQIVVDDIVARRVAGEPSAPGPSASPSPEVPLESVSEVLEPVPVEDVPMDHRGQVIVEGVIDQDTGRPITTVTEHGARKGRAPFPFVSDKKWQESFLAYIQDGNSIKATTALTGVSESLFHERRSQAEQNALHEIHDDFLDFLERMEVAKHARIALARDIMTKSLSSKDSKVQWDTAKWWLQFEQKEKHHEEGERHLHGHVVKDERRDLLEKIRKNPDVLHRFNELVLAQQLAMAQESENASGA